MKEVILQAALNHMLAQAEGAVAYPVSYLETCLDCWSERQLAIETIHEAKVVPAELELYKQCFRASMTSLQQLPALSADVIQVIASVADGYHNNATPHESAGWVGDVSTHFKLSSSFGEKGRILNTIVRCMRSQSGIELGSAYGMSAIFILEAMKGLGHPYHLATLEGERVQYDLSSTLLKNRYGDHVTSYFGWTQDKIPKMVEEQSNVDLLFHDAGHCREAYLHDVNAILPIMKPGAVVIVDDIRWNDPRFFDGDPRTHEGWMELAKGDRVLWSVEIDQQIGVMLLS